ncbi:hypothetical protein BB559_006685 [Furculomyces boomerangus]|uniref:Uncharacterized protein n=2 Tax=Harpellales TaxID=61421 RepID=A0A2T9Y140_9FUNG|nr:hypothetical protein BB559_006685 [Furculomyces boomerangus]PVZ99693.1 hypothetical protein BB558_004270 [Smittium angustum]
MDQTRKRKKASKNPSPKKPKQSNQTSTPSSILTRQTPPILPPPDSKTAPNLPSPDTQNSPVSRNQNPNTKSPLQSNSSYSPQQISVSNEILYSLEPTVQTSTTNVSLPAVLKPFENSPIHKTSQLHNESQGEIPPASSNYKNNSQSNNKTPQSSQQHPTIINSITPQPSSDVDDTLQTLFFPDANPNSQPSTNSKNKKNTIIINESNFNDFDFSSNKPLDTTGFEELLDLSSPCLNNTAQLPQNHSVGNQLPDTTENHQTTLNQITPYSGNSFFEVLDSINKNKQHSPSKNISNVDKTGSHSVNNHPDEAHNVQYNPPNSNMHNTNINALEHPDHNNNIETIDDLLQYHIAVNSNLLSNNTDKDDRVENSLLALDIHKSQTNAVGPQTNLLPKEPGQLYNVNRDIKNIEYYKFLQLSIVNGTTWSIYEKKRFFEGLQKYKFDISKICDYMGNSKSVTEVADYINELNKSHTALKIENPKLLEPPSFLYSIESTNDEIIDEERLSELLAKADDEKVLGSCLNFKKESLITTDKREYRRGLFNAENAYRILDEIYGNKGCYILPETQDYFNFSIKEFLTKVMYNLILLKMDHFTMKEHQKINDRDVIETLEMMGIEHSLEPYINKLVDKTGKDAETIVKSLFRGTNK